ncbi:MAG TPA: M56 family metallopeptidase [Pirellulales bacterium]|jgi:hypothetical protein
MNALGITAVWAIAQVSAVTLFAIGLYSVVRRRGPAAGSQAIVAALAVSLLVSALAISPWPRWVSLSPGSITVDSTPPVVHPSEGLTPGEMAPSTSHTAAQDATRIMADGVHGATGAATFWETLLHGFAQNLTATGKKSSWSWPAIVIAALAFAAALGISRLLVGLWAVRKMLGANVPVADEALGREIARLRHDLGCSRPIEVRASLQLASPVTIGWRRPLVILPDDWASWSESELRIALAHEIAHVARGDYAAGLFAQFCVAAHYYHPLVHWLARRLRLEQELSADATAAAVTGSRIEYLTTLARLALRCDNRPIPWAARPFLPASGTLLRRIDLLRDPRQLLTRPVTGWLRATIVGTLLVVGLLVAGVRGPGDRAVAAPPAAPPRVEVKEEMVQDKARSIVGEHAITIAGRATDVDGDPVAGATIHLVSFSIGVGPGSLGIVKTDALGRYEFRDAKLPLGGGEPPQGVFQVYANAPGHGLAWQGERYFRPVNRPQANDKDRPSHQDATVYADDKLFADLSFGAEATMRGRLVDESDKPIHGAKVHVLQCRRLTDDDKPAMRRDRYLVALVDGPSAMTDSDGRFVMPGLTKETAATITLSHPDFAEHIYSVALTDKSNVKGDDGRPMIVGDVNLRLDRGRKLSLQLLYGDTATPASGVSVTASRQEKEYVSASGKTDDHGAVSLILPSGKYELTIKPDRATPAGYLETKLPLAVSDAPQEQSSVLRMPAGCTLEIEVVDADSGQGIPNIFIREVAKQDPKGFAQVLIAGETDAAGKFRKLVPAGKHRYVPGVPPQYNVVVGSDPDLPIDLPGGKTVSLRFKLRKQGAENK